MLAEERAVGGLERLLYLRRAPMIGSLDAKDLAAIAEAARPRVFRPGERLLDEAARAPASFVLVEGRVRLERRGRPLGHATPGSALGGIGILAGAPPGFNATADGDVLALELEADALLELLEEHYAIVRHMLRVVASQLVAGWRLLPAGRTPPGPPPHREAGPLRDLDLVDRLFVLRRTTPFDKLSSNTLAELARGLSEQHFAAGGRIWQEGEPARHMLLVVHGRLDCSSSSGFRVAAHATSPLGAMEAIAGLPRWYTAEAQTAVVALSAEIETLFDVFEDNEEMAIRFLGEICRWLLAVAETLAEHDPGRLVTMGILGLAEPEPLPQPATSGQGRLT